MLLYHFPLTSNSATPNLENKGLKNDYTLESGWTFEQEGKLSSYCARTNKKGLNIPFGGDFTICFRVKSKIAQKHFANLLTTSIINIYYHAEDSNLNVYAAIVGNVYVRNLFTVDDNLFHDIVITRESDVVSLFVDKEKRVTFNTDASGTIKICSNPNYKHWDCYLQDIRVYDYCLSQQEIKEYSTALVLHYPLNGSELGNTIKDVSGFGNDYNLQGTNSYQLDTARGVKSLHTTDTAIYTQKPITSGYTTSFWCKYNGDWKNLCNNGSKYVNGVINSSLYDTIYATLISSGYDIVDYRVYATALSESDIKDLYNAPINFDKTTMNGIELSENAKYKSFAWRTPTYGEMNYILNTRTNASNLRGLGRVLVNGTYINGCFLLQDDFVAPSGVTFTPTANDYTTNSYTLEQFRKLEDVGVVFLPSCGYRNGVTILAINDGQYYLTYSSYRRLQFYIGGIRLWTIDAIYRGFPVRLVRSSQQSKFSTPTGNVEFAPANLHYHCTKHIWRFAENQYDYIGQANENISDTYDGWIDLFGYGTSGKNFSPTLHTTNNADYASGNISGTQNDWGVNEIVEPPYLDYDNKFHKTGVVKANEISEGTQCFDENGITYNKIKEI